MLHHSSSCRKSVQIEVATFIRCTTQIFIQCNILKLYFGHAIFFITQCNFKCHPYCEIAEIPIILAVYTNAISPVSYRLQWQLGIISIVPRVFLTPFFCFLFWPKIQHMGRTISEPAHLATQSDNRFPTINPHHHANACNRRSLHSRKGHKPSF